MMTQAFYTGISGLQTFQTGIDTVSNNLANISTVGFRGYNTEFSTLFEKAQNNGSDMSNSMGIGVKAQANSMDTKVGVMMLTEKSTDLAIAGDGWFGIGDLEDIHYTRAGNFSFDSNSNLVTEDGLYVLGTMGGNISGGILTESLQEIALGDIGSQEKLRFPKDLTYPAEPTSVVTFSGNVGADDVVRSMGANVVDPQNNRNALRLSFTQVIPQTTSGTQWNVTATIQSSDGETVYDTQTGQVNFDDKGALISNTLETMDNNGAEVTVDLGTGFDGLIAVNNVEIRSSSIADGIVAGGLEGYTVNRNSEVIAAFSNGMQSSVGKVAVYHFMNEQALERTSGTRFSQSSNSGAAHFYKDENGQNITGTAVTNYNLESSNVRMEVGLTELIIFQRAYDANSKSITTADEMMQKALNMDA